VTQAPSWVVMKFGGTSVSTAESWAIIAQQVKARLAEGLKPMVVCSALSGISDALERLLEETLSGDHTAAVLAIGERYRALAAELGVSSESLVDDLLDDLQRLALGASLVGEVSPRLRARVLSAGELLATRLGAASLAAAGVPVTWRDARALLTAEERAGLTPAQRYLSATCAFEPDSALVAALAETPGVVLTQGFIARNPAGETVLLGRGGSDTSAAYFAAKLGAVRCEIWTDVAGMFTADPRKIPGARLLERLSYEEARELASAGAKVLHPRCIAPVMRELIPLHVRATNDPERAGTVIGPDTDAGAPGVKAISVRSGVTLVSMDTVGMWQHVGFLADAFGVFRDCGLSIDLVSTSETNVTVSLDPQGDEPAAILALQAALAPYCEAKLIRDCAAVSLVGRGIRSILHRLGPALALFEEHRVHLVSQAASDLNLTVVVEQAQAQRLVDRLHALFFSGAEADTSAGAEDTSWWRAGREALLAVADEATPRYVYDGATVDGAAAALMGLSGADRVLFAMKANPHPSILRRLYAAGLGFECVSPGELARVFDVVPELDPTRVLFTPNFAPRSEYADALGRGVHVTLDDLHPLAAWPELFAGRSIFLRLDPGVGRGHHEHVRTAGARSKFGIDPDQLDRAAGLIADAGATVTGLHAHAGSGVLDPRAWEGTAVVLAQAAARFPDVEVLDLGGGLGVPERPGQAPLDMAALDASLARIRAAHPGYALWMEPGRFLVAGAGVLLARVTQVKRKGPITYVGVDAGMNSLIRPALYGAWHGIWNLTKLGEPLSMTATVVGPICESGDTLGTDRRLPETAEGDVLLIGTAGAYGHAMASHYNLRPPAGELVLG